MAFVTAHPPIPSGSHWLALPSDGRPVLRCGVGTLGFCLLVPVHFCASRTISSSGGPAGVCCGLGFGSLGTRGGSYPPIRLICGCSEAWCSPSSLLTVGWMSALARCGSLAIRLMNKVVRKWFAVSCCVSHVFTCLCRCEQAYTCTQMLMICLHRRRPSK